MMKILTAIASTALLSLSMTSVANASAVHFKAPINFNGTGCYANDVITSGAGTSLLTVIFGGYDAGYDSFSGQKRRASCNFVVPVRVPQGFQVSTLTADWEGFSVGSTQFNRKYFFAGQPTTRWLRDRYRGDVDILERDRLRHSTITWSGCGRNVNLRVNSNIRAKGHNSTIGIDTLDLQNKVQFHLKWRRCR